jgi:hypothetical protein
MIILLVGFIFNAVHTMSRRTYGAKQQYIQRDVNIRPIWYTMGPKGKGMNQKHRERCPFVCTSSGYGKKHEAQTKYTNNTITINKYSIS